MKDHTVNDAKPSKRRKLLLLGLSLGLAISLSLNVYQVLFVPKVERTVDFISTYSLSVTGICLGVIYFWLRSGIDRDREKLPKLTKSIGDSLKGKRDALNAILKDYETSNKEIERRENITLLVGTILVTASLIILGNTATTKSSARFPYAFSSILLFTFWLFVLNYTTAKLDSKAYARMHAIEKALSEKFDYTFGVHTYMDLVINNKKGKPFLWTEIRRGFWGVIMIALSTFWLVISLFP